jgi:hypothetical protein
VARGTKTNLVAVLQEFCYKFGKHGIDVYGTPRFKSVSLEERYA